MDYLLPYIDKRESRREYLRFSIEKEKVEYLNQLIEKFNRMNNFRIKLVVEDDDLFKSFVSSYGMIDGVRNYFLLVYKKNDLRAMEMLGYYGEILVLESTKLDLGTCWIWGTYDKVKCKSLNSVGSDEEVAGIIAVGYAREKKGIKEKLTKTLTKRKTKDIKELYFANEIVPQNFIDGIVAVQKAPSAINKQPVYFTYAEGKVVARVNGTAPYNYLDLGIAMLHFKLGSRSANEWYYDTDHYKLVL